MSKFKENDWEIISAKLHDELNAKEEEVFDKWIEDAGNKRLYQKAKSVRDGIEEARNLQYSDTKKSWRLIERKIRTTKFFVLFRNTLKYAAILVFAFLVGTYFRPFIPFREESQYAKVEVMYGQTSHLFLFDGTEVWLNAGTTFRYPKSFNSSSRDVYINGEAFFKVAPNSHLPFKVKTNRMEVEVLGTSFNVSAYSGEPIQSVVLVEGKVKINNPKGQTITEIEPGQRAVNYSNRTVRVETTDPYFHTSWKDGKVAFKSEKMSAIAKRLERWYNVEIRFKKESLKEYNLTGTILLNKPIEQTIMALEMLAPIRFISEGRINEKEIVTVTTK